MDLNGNVTGVVTRFMIEKESSYDITSDSFKSNPAYVKLLSSFVATRNGWPMIWASGGRGSIPAFTHLREPKHEWGIKHYPTFQSAVNLGYPIYNFKVYVSDSDYF